MWDRSANRKQVIPKLVSHINNIGQHGGGVIVMSLSIEARERNFISKFKNKFPDFEYVSGYEVYNSTIKIRCKTCGYIQERNAHSKPGIVCDRCEGINRRKEPKSKRTSRIYNKDCIECGIKFKTRYNNKFICSRKCKIRRSNRIKDIKRNKKIKENGEIEHSITLDKLIIRDKNICHICGDRCDREDFEITEEGYYIARERHPSIDHVIPIAKGGTHTWRNVKLAHRGCNIIKSDKIIYEENNGQLRMF